MRHNRRRIRNAIRNPINHSPPHVPPRCREVEVEIIGAASGLKRIDIVSDPTPTDATPAPTPEPEPRWSNIEEALEQTKAARRPDPWERLGR
jgi:hypothetical protein